MLNSEQSWTDDNVSVIWKQIDDVCKCILNGLKELQPLEGWVHNDEK